MSQQKEIRNIWLLIFLHLFPGLILVLTYYLLSQIGLLTGYPRLVLIAVASLIGIIGFQLGLLFYIAKKEVGSFNIFKIIGLNNNLNIKEYFVYTIGLFIITGLLITVLKPISAFLNSTVFNDIASWADAAEDMKIYSKSVIFITIVISFIFFTLIGPIIEELYFRGFLMSRMKWMGSYSPFINVILFASYHFWSPWMIISRIIGMTPLYYTVYKKNSLKLAIFVHCLVNFTDVVVLLTLL